jgi:hypothetical protein
MEFGRKTVIDNQSGSGMETLTLEPAACPRYSCDEDLVHRDECRATDQKAIPPCNWRTVLKTVVFDS